MQISSFVTQLNSLQRQEVEIVEDMIALLEQDDIQFLEANDAISLGAFAVNNLWSLERVILLMLVELAKIFEPAGLHQDLLHMSENEILKMGVDDSLLSALEQSAYDIQKRIELLSLVEKRFLSLPEEATKQLYSEEILQSFSNNWDKEMADFLKDS